MATNGNDQIRGSNGVADNFDGLGGDDDIYGFGSNDTIHGGADDDRLFGGAGSDNVFGDGGDDTLFIDTFASQSGNDDFDGGANYDIVDVRTARVVTGASNDGSEPLTSVEESAPPNGVHVDLGGIGNTVFALPATGNGQLFVLDTEANVGITADGAFALGSMTFVNIEEFRLTNFSDFFGGSSADLVVDLRGGNDLMLAGSGTENIIGGAGFDTVSYERSDAAVSVALLDGSAAGGFASLDQLFEIEGAAGSRFDDDLQGSNDNNTLIGLQGDDFLKGFGGNDTLLGGEDADLLMGNVGNDILDGGTGIDTATYAFNSHSVVVTLGANGADGTARELTTDTDPSLNPSSAVIANTDTLRGIENVIGSDDDDAILGNAGDNALTGRDGDDFLRGNAGDDTLSGGDGIDTADYSTHATGRGVNVNLTTGVGNELGPIEFQGQQVGTIVFSTDTLTGIENVHGSSSTDFLTGNSAANLLKGNGDNDRLAGLGGADTLDGDGGTDTADYSASAAGVTVNLTTGQGAGGDAQGDTLQSIENLVGSSGVDILSGNNSANRLEGGEGADRLIGLGNNDVLIGGGGSDQLFGGTGTNTMTGGANDDFYFVESATDIITEGTGQGSGDRVFASVSYTLGAGVQVETLSTANNNGTAAINLTGNELANSIYGNAGANTLDGKGSADTMIGLTGNDFYFVDTAADQVFEGVNAGNDRVFASVSYALAAGQEIETLTTTDNTGTAAINLTGNEFANTIFGNAGNNTLNGDDNADTLLGLGGDDFYFVDNAGDQVFEALGQGADRVFTSVSYTLGAGQQIERLSTADNAGAAAINLTGNEFANTIFGNAGSNTINGGLASDTLIGLGGQDIFAFTTALGPNNVDTIGDFGPINDDLIALDDAIFTQAGPVGQLSAAAFFTGAAAHDASDRIIYNAATGAVLYDADGTGSIAAVQFATVAGAPTIFESNFIVI